MTILIQKGSKPNPQFVPFEEILRSGALKEPNSTAITFGKILFYWYDTLMISGSYYVFKGSYYDPDLKKQVSTATCVVTQPPYNYISEKQVRALRVL